MAKLIEIPDDGIIRIPIIRGKDTVGERRIDLSDLPTVDAEKVLRCRDCAYWGDEDGYLPNSDGIMFGRCVAHNYVIDGRHTGWCPTENDFCSYGKARNNEID